VLGIAVAASMVTAATVGVARVSPSNRLRPFADLASSTIADASEVERASVFPALRYRPLRNATPVSPRQLDASVAPTATLATNKLNVNGIDHPGIDKWVTRLTTTLKRDFEVSLGRMSHYSPMITRKLEARQMPPALVYLPLIESNFNPSARSQASAVGLWQFMSATARRFGLKVGKGVDERKDPSAATDAALTYLSSLHDRFGSWYLAAAAYNSGEGTVLRALKKVTGRTTGTDADFFRISPALPAETRDYVPKLIASARVGQNPAQYGLTPVAFRPAPAAAPIRVAHRAAKSAQAAKTHQRIKASRAHRTSRAAGHGKTAKRSALHGSSRGRARR
jgi:soluble lytic murein transglycosylase-like protein